MSVGISHDYANPTNATMFSLVYGCEAILPLEIQLSSLHTTMVLDMNIEDNYKLRFSELEALDKRL